MKLTVLSLGFVLLSGWLTNPHIASSSIPVEPSPAQQSVLVDGLPVPIPEYSNELFQNVTVQKIGEDKYAVQGKARVFEGVIDYVVEDGHNELAKGTAKADKAAPGWGEFHFLLQVKKAEPNSTLILVLFEESGKDDGQRLAELPIALPER
ncbi:Gmad2 immunoglobulin-like domain-containing protein [Brevibacillus fulvus]|uniref:Bacterial spore germination immunoglobulin-like domain-containing protein n=1 Tax=Brevibacillus fulvus TaxID=1125967 RepID=A0A939BR44_9BACL|nr:hypothetical protein [Brevibacillus fulvus]